MTLRRFRKRPSDVVAVQWDGANWTDVKELLDAHGLDEQSVRQDGERLIVRDDMVVTVGDWLVRNADGHLFPSQNMLFVSNYDEIGPAVADEQDPS